jgi:hypothetical protein
MAEHDEQNGETFGDIDVLPPRHFRSRRRKKAAAFSIKIGVKFFETEPVPVTAARPKITKFFCRFLLTKSSSVLTFGRSSF